MTQVSELFKAEFEAKMFEMFPDSQTTGHITNAQLVQVKEALGTTVVPRWLMQTRVARGVYAFPVAGNNDVEPAEAKSVTVDFTNIRTLIPAVDSNYVASASKNYKDLELIIKSGMFYPSYISGPTGNGKSTMIEQICAKQKKPLIRVNLNSMTDEDQLIGTKTLVDGNVEIIEGPVLIAMRLGIPLLLDEIDAGSANTLLCLQPILEGKPYYFKLKNELITPKSGFNVFATANTKGKGSDDGRYIGTNVLNEAFLERFAVTFNQDYPTAAAEKKIVLNLMKTYDCESLEYAETLVKWADVIRRTFDDGAIDENITTRRLVHVVRAFSIFKDEKKAIELCVNRFDDATRLAFVDLFDKVAGGEEGEDVVLTDADIPVADEKDENIA